MDWRSTASQQEQDDLDNLLGASVGLVHEMLSGPVGLAPFALTIGADGGKSLRRLTAAAGDEHAIWDALTFAGDQRDLRARIIVYPVTARQPFAGEAVKFVAEHARGVAIDLLVPYTSDGDVVNIDMAAANAAAGARHLWA